MNNTEVTLDLANLPIGSTRHYTSPLYWGTLAMITIEGSVMAVLVAAYFYYRMNFSQWPPADAGNPDLTLPFIGLVLFLVSLIPMIRIAEASAREDRERLRRLLFWSFAIMLAVCILRGFEFQAYKTSYHEHAYGSIVWAILGAHSLHMITSTIETALMAISVGGDVPLDAKHRLDLHVNCLYWYFVVGSWVPLFSVLQGGARVL